MEKIKTDCEWRTWTNWWIFSICANRDVASLRKLSCMIRGKWKHVSVGKTEDTLAWVSGFSGDGIAGRREEKRREEKPDTKAFIWPFRPLATRYASTKIVANQNHFRSCSCQSENCHRWQACTVRDICLWLLNSVFWPTLLQVCFQRARYVMRRILK